MKPLLSICCTAYNQEAYIRDTLDGFVMQQCNFPFEIIIHDDASTDKTADIIREYQQKYPDLIKPIYQKENQYSKGIKPLPNFVWPKAQGKYIALCEGDDYWTDSLKLDKQISFLEKNPEYGLIYSKARVFNEKKGTYEKNTIGRILYKDELMFTNYIPALTTVFRKDAYKQYIQEVNPNNKGWKMGDYPCWLWISFNYKIKFSFQITATYRLLEESASHTSDINKKYIYNVSSFDVAKHFARQYYSKSEYIKFLEKRYFFLYLFCMKHNLQKQKNEYFTKIIELDNLRLKTKTIFFLFHYLKFEYIYRLKDNIVIFLKRVI